MNRWSKFLLFSKHNKHNLSPNSLNTDIQTIVFHRISLTVPTNISVVLSIKKVTKYCKKCCVQVMQWITPEGISQCVTFLFNTFVALKKCLNMLLFVAIKILLQKYIKSFLNARKKTKCWLQICIWFLQHLTRIVTTSQSCISLSKGFLHASM